MDSDPKTQMWLNLHFVYSSILTQFYILGSGHSSKWTLIPRLKWDSTSISLFKLSSASEQRIQFKMDSDPKTQMRLNLHFIIQALFSFRAAKPVQNGLKINNNVDDLLIIQ